MKIKPVTLRRNLKRTIYLVGYVAGYDLECAGCTTVLIDQNGITNAWDDRPMKCFPTREAAERFGLKHGATWTRGYALESFGKEYKLPLMSESRDTEQKPINL